jgi:uncharacterized membrane protein YqiK
LAIGAAIVFGFLVFLFLAGVVVVLAGIVGIRIWWVGRRLRKLHETAAKSGNGGNSDRGIIEGEYHVVTKRRSRERQ